MQVNTGFASLHSSSSVPLTAGATFTASGEDVSAYASAICSLKTDQPGTLYMEFSPDGTNWDSSLSFSVAASINEVHRITITRKYFRARFTNTSASNQTYFRLQTIFGQQVPLTSALNFPVQQDADALLVRSVTEDEILAGRISGHYIVSKFGRNGDVDAAEDIHSTGGTYTGFPTTSAENFEVISTSTSDTSGGTGARTVRVYYMNDDYEMFDSSGNALYVDVTMNGQTGVDTGVSGMRAYRAKVLTSGSGTTNAGDITIRWRTTTANIFCAIPTGYGQTESTAFTIPAGYKGYIKRFAASMEDNTANSAQMTIKARDFGSNTFRFIRPFALSTTKSYGSALYGGIEMAEKTDFVFRALSVANANGIITVDYDLLLVKQ